MQFDWEIDFYQLVSVLHICVCVFLHDSLVFYVLKMQFNLNITNKNIIWFYISYIDCIFFRYRKTRLNKITHSNVYFSNTSIFWLLPRFKHKGTFAMRKESTRHSKYMRIVWTYTYRTEHSVFYFPRTVEIFSCAPNWVVCYIDFIILKT